MTFNFPVKRALAGDSKLFKLKALNGIPRYPSHIMKIPLPLKKRSEKKRSDYFPIERPVALENVEYITEANNLISKPNNVTELNVYLPDTDSNTVSVLIENDNNMEMSTVISEPDFAIPSSSNKPEEVTVPDDFGQNAVETITPPIDLYELLSGEGLVTTTATEANVRDEVSTLSPSDMEADLLLKSQEPVTVDDLLGENDIAGAVHEEEDTSAQTYANTSSSQQSLELIHSHLVGSEDGASTMTMPSSGGDDQLTGSKAIKSTPRVSHKTLYGHLPLYNPATDKMIIRNTRNNHFKVIHLRNSKRLRRHTKKKKNHRKRAVGDENHILTGPVTPSPLPPIITPPPSPYQGPGFAWPPSLMQQRQPEDSLERSERRKQNLEKMMQFVTVVGHMDRFVNSRLRSSVRKIHRMFETEEDVDGHRRRRRYSLLI